MLYIHAWIACVITPLAILELFQMPLDEVFDALC
jgi:hypothetical protein